MSSLLLLGVPEEEALALLPNLFDRILVTNDLESLISQLYKDRVSESPNRWSYESGESLVLYRDGHSNGMARQLPEIFARFFSSFNIRAVPISRLKAKDFILHDFMEELRSEKVISGHRLWRMNHWIYHQVRPPSRSDRQRHQKSSDRNYCSMRIYSLISHLRNGCDYDRLAKVSPIPRIIRTLKFEKFFDEFEVDDKSESKYMALLSTWDFCALSLSTQELIYCAFILIRQLSSDANLRIPDNKLLLLLFTLEASYHQVNNFHNFRHAIDVMQATWQLCTHLLNNNALYTFLLCITAIGHDVGHPGANNQLLCNYNSSIAEEFNMTSVLENFHIQIFEQILVNHWPQLIKASKKNCSLISEAILATDMALHTNYVQMLKGKQEINDMALICLIIKAADISNVTRPLVVSSKWAFLITLEFKDCTMLEHYKKEQTELHCTFDSDFVNLEEDDPKEIHDMIYNDTNLDEMIRRYPNMPSGQLFFINTFAEEFYDELAKAYPQVLFLTKNVQSNKRFWLSKLPQLPD